MAKTKILIDTDILIDALKGIQYARALLKTRDIEIYCSILTRKELLSKEGLRDSERKRVTAMLSRIRILRIDEDITRKLALLTKKYGERPDMIADLILPQLHGQESCRF